MPIFPYVGDAGVYVGLYSSADQKRLPLHGQDMGQRAYKVGTINLLPQTENLFTVFKDGWHPAEVAERECRRRVAVDQEGGDARVQESEEGRGALSRARQPWEGAAWRPQQVQVIMGGQALD